MLVGESAELPIDHVEDFLGALSGDFLGRFRSVAEVW
jgi:hypothetical protein